MQERTVNQLFMGEDVRYRVPIYQRHYVWNKTHWEHLWDDIEEKANSILNATGISQPVPHFTGVIVTRRNEEGEVEVIDGQQRLTTFQIILCAIRDICKDKFPNASDPKEILKGVDKLLRNPSHPEHETTPDKLYKLLPTEGSDREALRALVTGTSHVSNGLLPEAHNHFKEEIERYVDNHYNKMVILSQTLFFFIRVVEMPLRKDDPTAKIFESLNGRGLPLTQFDLLRNNMFLRAGNNRNNFYENCWRHFNKETYWFSDKIVDDFLQNFLEVKLNREYKSNRSLFDLYYRVFLGNLRRELGVDIGHEDDQTLVELEFEELQRYSSSYAEIANCSEESPIWFYKFLKEELQIKSWHSLILLLKTELGLSEDNEEKIFRILESYIVRNILCYPEIPEWIRESHFRGLRLDIVSLIRRANNSFEVIVSGILEILTKKKNEWPWSDDPQIAEALHAAGHHWSRALIRYILFKIECKNTDTKFTDIQLTWSPQLNTEHVMPRDWENAKEKKSDKKLWPVAVPGAAYHKKARERDHFVESIGNLTLLNKNLNLMIDTNSFSTKKGLYRLHSRLSLTADIIYDNNGQERNEWDVKEIQEREEKLVKLFCEIWPSADAFEEN